MTLHTAPVSADLRSIVLLVDDDRDTREMYSAYFESAGMWVATAADPDQARKVVADVKPSLVVTDLGFGGIPSGVEFVHGLKGRAETQDTPVIILSGRSAEEVPAGTRHEADLLLVKPVLPDSLLACVQELLESSKTLRARNAASQ